MPDDTQKAEAGGSQIQLSPEPQSEFMAKRNKLVRPCLKTSEEMLCMELSGRALASHYRAPGSVPGTTIIERKKESIWIFL